MFEHTSLQFHMFHEFVNFVLTPRHSLVPNVSIFIKCSSDM